MLNKNVEKVLLNQIEKEAYSSNFYLAMAVWAETSGFQGIADWLYAQAEEERVHMLKFIKYVNERGGKAIVPAVDQPPAGYDNVLSVFEKVLEHEIYVSELINNIVGVCIQEKDFTTNNWIQWFVTEQIEEEASVRSVCDKLKLIGDHNLYMFDRDIMAMRNPGAGASAAN